MRHVCRGIVFVQCILEPTSITPLLMINCWGPIYFSISQAAATFSPLLAQKLNLTSQSNRLPLFFIVVTMTDNNPHPESDNKQQDVPAVPAFTKEDLLARISKTQTILSDDNPDLPPVLTFTQEAIIKRMAEAQTQFRQQHPELPESDTDLKLSSEWWKPMFALNTAVDVSIPSSSNPMSLSLIRWIGIPPKGRQRQAPGRKQRVRFRQVLQRCS